MTTSEIDRQSARVRSVGVVRWCGFDLEEVVADEGLLENSWIARSSALRNGCGGPAYNRYRLIGLSLRHWLVKRPKVFQQPPNCSSVHLTQGAHTG